MIDLVFINTILNIAWYIGFGFWLIYKFTSFFSFVWGAMKGMVGTARWVTNCFMWIKYQLDIRTTEPQTYVPLNTVDVQYESELEHTIHMRNTDSITEARESPPPPESIMYSKPETSLMQSYSSRMFSVPILNTLEQT